jgi:putative transposase
MTRSSPGRQHQVYPYLLRGLAIESANEVWAMDITYIPMARGFVYLAAIMDWHRRKVLAWEDRGHLWLALAMVLVSISGRKK